MSTLIARAAALFASISNVKFGVEVEHGGITRHAFASAMAKVVKPGVDPETILFREPSNHDAWCVNDGEGRTWRVMSDGSVNGLGGEACEMVTPPLKLADMDLLQEVLRKVRDAGAVVDRSCGIHVHVDAAGMKARHIRNLVRLTARVEPMLVGAMGVQPSRVERFCKATDARKVRAFNAVTGEVEAKRDRAAQAAWYGTNNPAMLDRYTAPANKYDNSRYHGLNLHSTFTKGTVEFRWFEAHHAWATRNVGKVHAGKVRAYVLLALLMREKAMTARAAPATPITGALDKYNVNHVLLSLGAYGDDFEVLRTHLVNHLPGHSAWKHARPPMTWLRRYAPHRIPEFYSPAGLPLNSTTPGARII